MVSSALFTEDLVRWGWHSLGRAVGLMEDLSAGRPGYLEKSERQLTHASPTQSSANSPNHRIRYSYATIDRSENRRATHRMSLEP